MCGSRGGQGSGPPEKSQNIGFLSNTGPGPLKNQKASKPAFNVGLSSAARFYCYLDPLFRYKKKIKKMLYPLWQNSLDPRMQLTRLYALQFHTRFFLKFNNLFLAYVILICSVLQPFE